MTRRMFAASSASGSGFEIAKEGSAPKRGEYRSKSVVDQELACADAYGRRGEARTVSSLRGGESAGGR